MDETGRPYTIKKEGVDEVEEVTGTELRGKKN